MNVAVKSNVTKPIPHGLPNALKPWIDVFQHMPESSLRIVGGLMGQLDSVLREAYEMELQTQGEFHGYDGMEVKGHIDRLMPSEWLWKELEPEEFLRRFAEQELLFHRPSYENPTDERTHLVVLDCGPAMLGRPRIVALAVLLCLFAQARSRGARVLWIAPHAHIEEWQSFLNLYDLDIFLKSANPLSLTASALEGAIQRLPGDIEAEDIVLWAVGGHKLALEDYDLKVNQVVVTETLRPGPEGEPIAEGRVFLKTYSGRTRTADLTFPDEGACVVLLREPFRMPIKEKESEKKKKEALNPSWAPQSVLIDTPNRRVLLRVPAGVLVLTSNFRDNLAYRALLEVKQFEHLLGVHYKGLDIIIAVTRRYNTYGQVILRRYSGSALADETVLRVDDDHPILFHDHGKHALPPLVKPGRRFRFIALSGAGERFVITHGGIEIPLQLKEISIQAYLPERFSVAAIKEGKKGNRYLSMRNLVTDQHYSFPVPSDVDIKSERDFSYLENLSGGDAPGYLVVRGKSGKWFGGEGYHIVSEVELSADLWPVGMMKKDSYNDDVAPKGFFWNKSEQKLFCYDFPSDGTVVEHWSENLTKDYAGIGHNIGATFRIGWINDDNGYPMAIDTLTFGVVRSYPMSELLKGDA